MTEKINFDDTNTNAGCTFQIFLQEQKEPPTELLKIHFKSVYIKLQKAGEFKDKNVYRRFEMCSFKMYQELLAENLALKAELEQQNLDNLDLELL